MEEYNFYVDSKHTVWIREYHSVKANSEEEAIEKAKMLYKNRTLSDSTESETLSETYAPMSYEENQNNPTEELMWPGKTQFGGQCLADNTPIDIVRDNKINTILENEK